MIPDQVVVAAALVAAKKVRAAAQNRGTVILLSYDQENIICVRRE